MDHLKETHPDLVNVIRIGKSSQGRPIKVIHLSSGREQQKAKKAIFIDAGKLCSGGRLLRFTEFLIGHTRRARQRMDYDGNSDVDGEAVGGECRPVRLHLEPI